jgi:1-acyl-sn-glycerol-3-phosphate acyltransferase
MSATLVNVRSKKVPTLYESDESKYVGPHPWQTQMWARMVRRAMRYRSCTRWINQACTQVEVTGSVNLEQLEGPCVFVANHTSHLDTLVIQTALPEKIRSRLYFGAAQDRWFVKGKKKTVLKPWYQSLVLGNFPILRGGGTRALSYADQLLKKQQHVFLFPEGTRATAEALGEFKHGSTILARDNQVKIVPIYLSGLRSIRPKGSREAAPGVVGVEILEPLDPTSFDDVASATQALQARMHAAHRNTVERPMNQAA